MLVEAVFILPRACRHSRVSATTFLGTAIPLFSRPARLFAGLFYGFLGDGQAAGLLGNFNDPFQVLPFDMHIRGWSEWSSAVCGWRRLRLSKPAD